MKYKNILSGVVYTGAESLQDGLRDVWTLLNDLGFILCAVPPVCYVVTTSDNRKKSEMGVSVSQIRYSLVVILELNDVSEVQYKDVMMIDDGKYQ